MKLALLSTNATFNSAQVDFNTWLISAKCVASCFLDGRTLLTVMDSATVFARVTISWKLSFSSSIGTPSLASRVPPTMAMWPIRSPFSATFSMRSPISPIVAPDLLRTATREPSSKRTSRRRLLPARTVSPRGEQRATSAKRCMFPFRTSS